MTFIWSYLLASNLFTLTPVSLESLCSFLKWIPLQKDNHCQMDAEQPQIFDEQGVVIIAKIIRFYFYHILDALGQYASFLQ